MTQPAFQLEVKVHSRSFPWPCLCLGHHALGQQLAQPRVQVSHATTANKIPSLRNLVM